MSHCTTTKKISVIIPTYNEENYIGKVLEQLLIQDYPLRLLEIIVVDGMSQDKTREIVGEYTKKHPMICLLDNPEKFVPYALNKGIKNSTGDVVIRMDAHSEYPEDYISLLVRKLYYYNADNVGGVWVTKPGSNSLVAKVIALATSSRFGIGNARYRLGNDEDIEVDTVPFGCYKKEVFSRIGYFDIDLLRNQDDEFNARLLKNAGKIYLIPSVKIIYYARGSILKLVKMFYQYGLFKPLVNKKIGKISSVRQLFPPVFSLSIFVFFILSFFSTIAIPIFLFILSIYVISAVVVSATLISKIDGNRVLSFFLFPVIFLSIHMSYGIGYLVGFFNIIFKANEKLKSLTSSR